MMAGLYLHPLIHFSNKGALRVVSEDPTITIFLINIL